MYADRLCGRLKVMIKAIFRWMLKTDGAYAYMADGKRRRMEAPKKKKLMHLAPTATVLSEESLSTNRQIRTALTAYRAHTT